MTATASDMDLPALAASIAAHIDDHFPPAEAMDRQVLCLAEEVGEFIGAYRRANGMARRMGSFEDVRAELADVVITAYVTAHVLDITVPESARTVTSPVPYTGGIGALSDVLTLGSKVGQFIDAYHPVQTRGIGDRLTDVIRQAYVVASVMRMDLDAAISKKLQVIFTRGWKESNDG